jgi:hypothetical protein
MTRLDLLTRNLDHARRHTLALLDRIDPADWFAMPPGGVTHVAWQVGHLAVADFRLAIARIREPRGEEADLLPPGFVERFAKGSTPESDPSSYPAPGEIRAVLDRVRRHVLAGLERLDDAELDEPPLLPSHPLFATRWGSLLWCGQHEYLHAGQITLIRRLLGGAPNW